MIKYRNECLNIFSVILRDLIKKNGSLFSWIDCSPNRVFFMTKSDYTRVLVAWIGPTFWIDYYSFDKVCNCKVFWRFKCQSCYNVFSEELLTTPENSAQMFLLFTLRSVNSFHWEGAQERCRCCSSWWGFFSYWLVRCQTCILNPKG